MFAWKLFSYIVFNYFILYVCTAQVVKLLTCFVIIAVESGRGLQGLVDCLASDVVGKPSEMLKISVPSLVYTVQNNLLYFALSHLDAATYMVCYQVRRKGNEATDIWRCIHIYLNLYMSTYIYICY